MFSDINNDGIVTESEIIQEDHYYPFGLKHEGYGRNVTQGENFYQYNGKELNKDFGLDWYSYGFRSYDAAIGRFPSCDPIAENFAFVSPYNYAENEPISSIDLWGLQRVQISDKRNSQDEIESRKVNSKVTVKILNLSSYDDYRFNNSIQRMSTKSGDTFSGAARKRVLDSSKKGLSKQEVLITNKVTVEVKLVDHIDKIGDTDFAMIIVDKIGARSVTNKDLGGIAELVLLV
jgi:RHS repeat-associated protein